MAPEPFALWTLEQEARALLCRLRRVKSFALQETTVPAASLSVEAQAAIERFLARGRRKLRRQVKRFLAWVTSPPARAAAPAEAQRRFTLLRLQFNIVLTHFDIFSEALEPVAGGRRRRSPMRTPCHAHDAVARQRIGRRRCASLQG